MGVHIHRSERTDTLLRGLADLLTDTPADPFTPDIVAVPTPGIERFITQGLGLVLGTSVNGRDGVCANVDFPSPATVATDVISQATGVEPRTDPWLPHRAVWPLLSVIDRSAAQHWCEPLARHLGLLDDDPIRHDRRFAVASRIARLFATYASQRPGMLLDWARGDDTDGAGAPIPDDLAWQPHLWRTLRDEIGTPSLAERLDQACRAVRADAAIVDLPARLSVFGASRLPADQLQVLAALGQQREVHLWLADASPALWTHVVPPESRHRRDDTSAAQAVNPLLRSMGRDARELRIRLAQQVPADTDEHLPSALPADSLLGHLQRQIRDNQDPWRVRHSTGPVDLRPDDHSIRVHACHGQARQAEVVHEVLLGLLEADPTLEPRDILIMCPDLEATAPLLSAAFSSADKSGSLRLRIADRTPEQTNLVLSALAALLDLLTSRLELSALLDFAALPPVRARFQFDDDGLERLEALAPQAGVRWGLDDQTRAEFLVRIPAGTWAWGLDRLLLGAAMSEDGLAMLDGVLPVDDVNSSDVELVGRLAELVTRLQSVRDAVQGRHSIDTWVEVLSGALTDLVDARGTDAWQLPNALGAISGLTDAASGYAGSLGLSLADIRWLLSDILRGRPTRSNFRSGDLTVCGLVPMRSVPHRVICLVGMDDGSFPRAVRADGDDVMARDPLLGERDLRSEDRQLLLDAVMAATDHLVVTYTGADERTNEPRPPCVPLGDLLDTVHAMGAPRESVRVDHPLQPFDPRNFTPGKLGVPGPFSHDESALAAARRAAEPRDPAPTMHLGGLPPLPVEQVSPQELGTFLCSPPAAFLRTRIGVPLRGDDEPASERIPLTVNGLEQWQIGNRTLRLLTHGEELQSVAAAQRARGDLPPGALGEEAFGKIGDDAQDIAQRFTDL
ncbi:MAG TPA: exodeoxyribonuclease V subunit gamma, partial [Actinomycetota bacterium]|nr:exodeoxyribonuclease V subunit gamma [Actinomycetota bacterium]